MKKPDAPTVVFTVKVYARPAMSRAVQSGLIREVLHQCIREFGGGVGDKLKGDLFGEYDQMAEARPLLGSWTYEPSAPP